MEILFKENVLTINTDEKVDSSNAQAFEEQIFSSFSNSELKSVVFDFKKLKYISSAGLRVILKIRKICSDITIQNVNTDVYEILEMTGFSEMMNVVKAYREISVEGCEVLGVGSMGKVYKIDNGDLVKTYLNPESLESIKRERELARTALILGVPTSISYEVVKVGDGYGSVFEMLDADSFSKLFAKNDGKFDEYMDLYVNLLKTIHSKTSKHPLLCDAKTKTIRRVEMIKQFLDEERHAKLIRMVNEIPDDDTLLHGDYHIKNVMMQGNEVMIIDMDTLSRGNIIFEFNGMHEAYIAYNLRSNEDSYFLGVSNEECEHIYNSFIDKYFSDKSKDEIEDIKHKIEVASYVDMLAYALDDPEYFENDKGFDLYSKLLKEAIDKVEDLVL